MSRSSRARRSTAVSDRGACRGLQASTRKDFASGIDLDFVQRTLRTGKEALGAFAFIVCVQRLLVGVSLVGDEHAVVRLGDEIRDCARFLSGSEFSDLLQRATNERRCAWLAADHR